MAQRRKSTGNLQSLSGTQKQQKKRRTDDRHVSNVILELEWIVQVCGSPYKVVSDNSAEPTSNAVLKRHETAKSVGTTSRSVAWQANWQSQIRGKGASSADWHGKELHRELARGVPQPTVIPAFAPCCTISAWRADYNLHQPHSSPADLMPQMC